MQSSHSNIYRPSRVAGGLLLWFALLQLLSAGSLRVVATALGLGLVLSQDSSKLDIWRGVTLLWCVGSALILVPAATVEGLWWPAVQAIVFCASVGFLMFDGHEEPAVAGAALAGFGVLLF